MPDSGKVRVRKDRGDKPYIDFYPDLKGKDRFLWGFLGKGFASPEEAETVRSRINALAVEVGLSEAVERFRSVRSRSETVTSQIEEFLEAAATMGSLRDSGEPYSQRTLEHYRAVLKRAEPKLAGRTVGEFFKPANLMKFKAWFRDPQGRALKSDTEMVNCFAALKAFVRYYRLSHPNFSVDWPPLPTKTTIAKKARKERRSRGARSEATLQLAQVSAAIEAVEESRRPIFWVMFFTQCRITEARAIKGIDYTFEECEGIKKGRVFIGRSAQSKKADAEIRDSTKTGVDGSYMMPEFVQRLIASHCSHARFDPDLPLFRNPDPRATGPMFSDDALTDTWRAALVKLGLPWVPLYRAMKHTQISALRDSGLPIDLIVEQCRWTSSAMLTHYDREQDKRRDQVVKALEEQLGPR